MQQQFLKLPGYRWDVAVKIHRIKNLLARQFQQGETR